jgi:phosphate transport system substrate-binding protein
MNDKFRWQAQRAKLEGLSRMSLKCVVTFALSAALLLSVSAPSFSAGELKINGSASLGALINKNKAAIEQETGLTLKVTANGDGNGLKDLTAGTADIAIVGAGDLWQATAESMNKASPGAVNVADLEVTQVGTAAMKFIANPANLAAKSLTEAQLKDIFTGKITSWKEVGGADMPIMVASVGAGTGARVLIVKTFLGGMEITGKARVVQALAQLSQIVAQVPGAISYGNEASITDAVAVIPGTEVLLTQVVVTKGPPSADAKKLIEAVTKYAARK